MITSPVRAMAFGVPADVTARNLERAKQRQTTKWPGGITGVFCVRRRFRTLDKQVGAKHKLHGPYIVTRHTAKRMFFRRTDAPGETERTLEWETVELYLQDDRYRFLNNAHQWQRNQK